MSESQNYRSLFPSEDIYSLDVKEVNSQFFGIVKLEDVFVLGEKLITVKGFSNRTVFNSYKRMFVLSGDGFDKKFISIEIRHKSGNLEKIAVGFDSAYMQMWKKC